MPDLISLYLRSLAWGALLAVLLCTGLVALNPGGLGRLLWEGPDRWLALGLLAIPLALLFSGVCLALGLAWQAGPDGPRGPKTARDHAP